MLLSVRSRQGLPLPYPPRTHRHSIDPSPSTEPQAPSAEELFQIGIQDAFFPLQKRLWLVFFVIMKLSLHIFRPSCALTSQLSLKMCANLPSKMISHRNCDPPNLDFCNTLQCFSRFFNISSNRFKDASQAPKYLRNTFQEAHKSSPTGPKWLPRGLSNDQMPVRKFL